MTYDELAEAILKLSPEQRKQEAQIVKSKVSDEMVNVGKPVIYLGSVEELQFRYFRSAVDNTYRPDDVVLLIDGNPHAKDGAIAYQWLPADDDEDFLTSLNKSPIYRGGQRRDESDWTGPAQKLREEYLEKNPFPAEEDDELGPAETAILKNRMKDAGDKADENVF